MIDISWAKFLTSKFRKALGFPAPQKNILTLLPSEFSKNPKDSLELVDLDDGSISKFINVQTGSEAKFKYIANNIFKHTKVGNITIHTFYDYKAIRDIENKWIELINNLRKNNPETFKAFEQHINNLIATVINSIESNNNVSDKLKRLQIPFFLRSENLTLSAKATSLTLIASTSYFWSNYNVSQEYSNIADDLAPLIFPLACNKTENPELLKNIEMEHTKQQDDALYFLKCAQSAYTGKNYKYCIDCCRKIIDLNWADNNSIGTAYYLLVKCCSDNNYSYEGYYNTDEFKHRAISYGCEEAKSEWEVTHIDTLLYSPTISDCTDKLPSLIVTNTDNEQYKSFYKTLPEEFVTVHPQSVIYTPSTSDVSDYLKPGEKQKYLFIDDNYEKNFQDTLHILQTIRQWDNKKTDAVWDISIYMRANEDEYSALLDTAISYMNDIVIPVHILDDAKWTAQRLLSLHPLFYPIRSLSERILKNNPITLHFVILCNNNNDLVKWLVREASWLGCFHYPNITLAISVLSPDADIISDNIRCICPGIFNNNIEFNGISKLLPPEFIKVNLNSIEIIPKLEELSSSDNHFLYFAVDAGSDIASLNLGIRIREWCIRKSIESGYNIKKNEAPVIAFHCKNPDIAHLSKSMVVQTEAHGNSWYNDYSLIPFGVLHERYSLNNLDGGYLEKTAQCIHLQYCSTPTDSSEEVINNNLKSYFNKVYNRDSSMAVSLSLPYRLFQISGPDGHIYPTGWNIANESSYTNDNSIKSMAKAFEEIIKIPENINTLAVYEHARWCRYMLSRGWLPSSPEETIAYIKNGNPKQQLYIGRLHSCICSWEDLSVLQHKLSAVSISDSRFKRYAQPDFFTKLDRENIEHTPNILRTDWFTPESEKK